MRIHCQPPKQVKRMADVLVVYYSRGGSVAALARQIARGVGEIDGMTARLRTVPPVASQTETAMPPVPETGAPFVTTMDLDDCAGLAIGTPTRFGNMSGQMRTFLDQTGGLWASGALYGKIASVFSSTGTGGGQEQTITSTWTTLAHHGMIIVPIGYGAQELFDISQVRGGTPYGATTIAGGDGSRQPSEEELAIARYQGEHVAKLAVKVHG